MSALTLLIWERWDFSSSRSSSSRCAFFMASMAAWDSTVLAPRAAPPKGVWVFLSFHLIFKSKPESSSKLPTASQPVSLCPWLQSNKGASANPTF